MSKLFIRIGQVNRKLVILILIYSVTVIFTELNFFFSSRDTNNIIDFFVSSLGEIFGGILMPYIVKNKTTIKSKKKTSKKQSVKDYFLLFIILLIFAGAQLLVIISANNNTLQLSILGFLQGWEIILFLILTYFFLKYKYYIHHIISLSIFCISCVLLDIILGHFSNLGLSLLYMFIYVSFDAVIAIYLKYLMDYKYKQYWNILLAIGLIYFLSGFIEFIIQLILNKSQVLEMLKYYFTNTGVGYIILRFFVEFIFGGFFREMIKCVIIKNFSPDYILIGNQAALIFVDIYLIDEKYQYSSILLFIFLIFSLLFYLEIFEYNFCDLNKNTKRNIQLRAESENFIDDTIDDKIELSAGYIVKESEENNSNEIIEMKENDEKEDNIKFD